MGDEASGKKTYFQVQNNSNPTPDGVIHVIHCSWQREVRHDDILYIEYDYIVAC